MPDATSKPRHHRSASKAATPAPLLTNAFCVFIDTVCEGKVSSLKDDNGRPCLFATREAAEREIAEAMIDKLEEYMRGERDFEDAMTVEEYVGEVCLHADGTATTEDGRLF